MLENKKEKKESILKYTPPVLNPRSTLLSGMTSAFLPCKQSSR